MSKHTEGPWGVAEDNEFSVEKEGAPIALVYMSEDFPCIDEEDEEQADAEAEANARLIAAAPDLLAALVQAESALAVASSYRAPEQTRITHALESARAAISKARPHGGT